MGPCPYCGESIGAEARICRHCNRPVLYSVNLTASMEDRQKHEFLKLWQKEEFKNVRHFRFGPFADSKKQLDKIPLVLAWDLNRFTASQIAKKFEHLGIESRLQGGLPSTFEMPAPPPKTFSFINSLYIGLGLGLIIGAIYLFMDRQRQISLPQRGPTAEIFNAEQLKALQIPPIQLNQPNLPPSANPPVFQPEQTIERDSIEGILGATVFISGPNSLGSGFLITPDGYILSNTHVTKDMATPYVTLKDGRRFDARKIRDDPKYDISLIKIDANGLPFLKLGDANRVYAGEPVITIGNPGGLAFTVTRGIVSFNGRMLDGVPYIQTDAAINKGNSGGPMINRNLEVIGINTLTSLNEQGISFSLPINLACDANGVASGLGTDPSSCNSFDSPQQRMDAVSMGTRSSPGRSGPNPMEPYQREANEHKARLEESEKEIRAQQAELEQRVNDLKAQAQQDTINLSYQERLRAEFEELKSRSTSLQKSQADARLRYVNSMIGLLERQVLDPAFSQGRNEIEQQIQQLRESRQGLLDILNIP